MFVFAVIFATAMGCTVLCWRPPRNTTSGSGDPKEVMVGALAHSGRVVFAAAGVMAAVFFTFAASGPLPPKEMGIVLGVAVPSTPPWSASPCSRSRFG